MKKILLTLSVIIISIYMLFCGLLYLIQEKLIFNPQKTDLNYTFSFEQKFKEINIKASDGKLLNGILFKADSTKGLIFYLHGNSGNVNSWGNVAKTYTDLHYDVFILDYRSYGKSEGEISNQEQLFSDNQLVYNELKKQYSEDKIIVLGYSIGTGLASKLAADNKPKLLLLQAPYYSLTDVMNHLYPFVPSFILKYKFATNEYLKNCTMPVVIFHGDADEVIYYGSALKLKKEFKPNDQLITLAGQGHNGITYNETYKEELAKLLTE